MQPQEENQQNQGQMPHHVPISQLKEQLAQAGGQASNINNTATQQSVVKPQATNNLAPDATNNQQTNPEATTSSQQPTNNASPTATPQAPVEVNATDMFLRSLVGLQFFSLFIILIGFFPAALFFNTFAMVFGALMLGLGIFLGIWAIVSFRQKITPNPKPLRHSFLVTGGPYKYMRHPMYSALILASIGLTLVYPTITRLIALAVLIFVLLSKMKIEEYLLAKRYSHYARYQRLTGRIFPKLKKPDIDIDIPRIDL
jgi:protein-S-isoprenylcysteine O-methyltransferase Ste14